MTNAPKLWRDMTDLEKGALLLAWHEEEVIEYFSCHNWMVAEGPIGNPGYAYRIKPKAPKVEKVQSESHVWRDSEGTPQVGSCHDGSHCTLANITHTYTITDGIVTACDTIIHKKDETHDPL